MKKSLLVTALALVLALGTLIGLAVRLEGTVTPLGTKAVQSWGDPAAAGDLTVHTAAVFGERLFWNTDYHVAEEQENTRFTFRPQGQVQQLGALITDVKDEWYLTRLCLTESGDYVTADLLDESSQDQTRKVRAKDVFAAYGFYLTEQEYSMNHSSSKRVPFDKIRVPVGDKDELIEEVFFRDEAGYDFEYHFLRQEARSTPLTVGKYGHILVTLGFAADATVKKDWAPEGFGLWDVPVTVEEQSIPGGLYYTRRPDVDRAKLVFPLDIENQRVAALTETADGDILLVTAEDGQFVLRVLDGETCALLQELVLGAAETVTRSDGDMEYTDYETVTIRPEEGFTLLALNDQLLVLESGADGYRIGLRSDMMVLRFRWDAQGERGWTWCAAGAPLEDGNDYAGNYYGPLSDVPSILSSAVTYRDGRLALANHPGFARTDVFLEVYGDGGMLYGALLENGLESQANTESGYLSVPWTDPLVLTWGEE